MVEIRKISDKSYGYANILVFGESGSGKTRFASTYPEEKVLFINIVEESGMMTLRALNFNADVIDVSGYKQMQEAIEWVRVNGGKYDVLFIDSLSQWQKNLDKEIPDVIGANGKIDKFAKYSTIKDYTKETIKAINKLPFHTVFTCEIVKDKEEETGVTNYIPSLLGAAKHEIAYWFDEVYYFIRYQDSVGAPVQYRILTSAAMKYPCKSRLNLPQTIDTPNLKEILEKAGFMSIDKGAQAKELSSVKEVAVEDPRVTVIRQLIKSKDLNPLKVLKEFGASSIPGIPVDKLDDVIKVLEGVQ